ncbi:hypothetical protein DFJ73DRAFT_839127 [Zopfochytrium polystomum]|nr:hypothetical protein DFJ73DRAFT_839127 [Zopfochytrium polystomum]
MKQRARKAPPRGAHLAFFVFLPTLSQDLAAPRAASEAARPQSELSAQCSPRLFHSSTQYFPRFSQKSSHGKQESTSVATATLAMVRECVEATESKMSLFLFVHPRVLGLPGGREIICMKDEPGICVKDILKSDDGFYELTLQQPDVYVHVKIQQEGQEDVNRILPVVWSEMLSNIPEYLNMGDPINNTSSGSNVGCFGQASQSGAECVGRLDELLDRPKWQFRSRGRRGRLLKSPYTKVWTYVDEVSGGQFPRDSRGVDFHLTLTLDKNDGTANIYPTEPAEN